MKHFWLLFPSDWVLPWQYQFFAVVFKISDSHKLGKCYFVINFLKLIQSFLNSNISCDWLKPALHHPFNWNQLVVRHNQLKHVTWKKNTDKLFDWFSGNFLRADPNKCHLLIVTDKNVTLKIKNETTTNSSYQKLLTISFNNEFDFDEHVTSLCRKASQKLNALARVVHYMALSQCRLIRNVFILWQCGYCVLV